MKTDHPIYQFLSTGPEAFRVLTGGMTLVGPYRFEAPVLKGIERRIDGLFVPDGHDGPAYVVEFQAQHQPAAWYNLLAKIGLYGEAHPERDVRGVLVFLRRVLDPKPRDWTEGTRALLSAAYLDDFLPALLANQPDNPFVAVFAPLILDDDEALKRQAPYLWRTIHSATVPETVKNHLEQILEFWFIERFRALTDQEISNMLHTLVPLEETRAYQCIFAKGEARGEEKGQVKGEAQLLRRQIIRRFGELPEWARERLEAADVAQIEAWGDAIFDAADIEQLLGPRP